MSQLNMYDAAQQALGFLVEQTTYIEPQVYRIQYPDVQYAKLIPIDTSANMWAKSVTYYSVDRTGQADWFDAKADDMRKADVNRDRHEVGIHMAGIGYGYDLEELGQAMMIPGQNLSTDRADAARRAAEEFTDRVALVGDASKGLTGLFNDGTVTRVDAAPTGASSARTWASKTADNIIADVNDALTGVYTGTLTVEMADTVLLPITQLNLLGTIRISNTDVSALDYLRKNNVYSQVTGAPLMIMGALGLDTAGNSGTARMIAYRKDPGVLKMHIPMTHRFWPVWQTGPLRFDIPGTMRLAGVEWRRPKAGRYVDGI